MPNSIKRTSLFLPRLDPAEADLWVSVYPEHLTADTVVCGRLTGPKCVYASTVEVAYHFREHSRTYETDGEPHIIVRARIPEPNLWDPVSPFLYQGTLELWQGNECCEQQPIRHGLRVLGLSPKGLRWNSQPLTLRGTSRSSCSEDEAHAVHHNNCNTMMAPMTAAMEELWDVADRFGFLMLGRVSTRAELQQVTRLRERTCSLGWIVTTEMWQNDDRLRPAPGVLGSPHERGQLLGLELCAPPAEPLPKEIHFIACMEEALPALTGIDRPKLILGRPWAAAETAPPGILGWIEG